VERINAGLKAIQQLSAVGVPVEHTALAGGKQQAQTDSVTLTQGSHYRG